MLQRFRIGISGTTSSTVLQSEDAKILEHWTATNDCFQLIKLLFSQLVDE